MTRNPKWLLSGSPVTMLSPSMAGLMNRLPSRGMKQEVCLLFSYSEKWSDLAEINSNHKTIFIFWKRRKHYGFL